MEKFLITGFSGFVSRHFLDHLENQKFSSRVLGVDVSAPDFNADEYRHVKCSFEKTNLLDDNQVENIIFQFQPDYILHLASYSSVAFSWKDPIASFSNNTNIFLNLLEKVRALNLGCRILSVGSSEEYGNVSASDVPLAETHPLNPVSPYAVARVSQEMLSRVYVDGYGLDIVMTRSFNHIGPRQRDIFAVSSFARQLVEIKKKGLSKGELVTGDISIVRDFLDVRDVVAAYHSLFRKGRSGEVYNICSGIGVTLERIIAVIAEILNIKVGIKVSEKLIRPSDNRIIIGSNEKLKRETGWDVSYDLRKSLEDIVAYWDSQI